MYILKIIPPKEVLKKSVFVYPTETCYGIGCDATNERLVERIYKIKGRDVKKQVSWIVADIDMAKQYVEFSSRAHELAKRFWPGSLTLVLRKKDTGDDIQTIALRVSSHPIAQKIVDILGKPIVATSANLSGAVSSYTIFEVVKQFKRCAEKPDFIIDGGVLKKKAPSTIVEVIEDTVKILRQGEIIIRTFAFG
jgi:L-threonylcarbamoyladenylate synthase